MKQLLLLSALVVLIIAGGCNKDDNSPPSSTSSSSTTTGSGNCLDGVFNSQVNYGTVQDIDSNVYKTVQIGSQTWMAENLRTTRYQNGDVIPNLTDSVQWTNATSGAWTYYENNPQYECPNGKLYNHYTVTDQRNVCPTGWHVPYETEWHTLFSSIDSGFGPVQTNAWYAMPFSDPNAVRSLLSVGTSNNPIWQTGGHVNGSPEITYFPVTGMTNTTGFSLVATGRYYRSPFESIHEFQGIWQSERQWTASSHYSSGQGITGIGIVFEAGNFSSVWRVYDRLTDGSPIRCIKD